MVQDHGEEVIDERSSSRHGRRQLSDRDGVLGALLISNPSRQGAGEPDRLCADAVAWGGHCRGGPGVELPNWATIRSFLLQSIDVNNKRWRLNLPVLAAEMNKIVGFPDVVGVFDGPCLFLTGADSPYVAQVDRPKIKSLFSAAKFAKIPGVGHWLHAEKPREFEATVRYFLDLAS